MKNNILATILLALFFLSTEAATVNVTMNSTSPTMTLADKVTGENIDVGEAVGRTYTIDLPASTYVLTAYATDKTTINGTIELTVNGNTELAFNVLTCTVFATNPGWTADEDYTVNVSISTREGQTVRQTMGQSINAGRRTFLAFNGNSYYADLTPNEAHQAEGYMTLYRQGTLTSGINIQGMIPMGYDYTITLPADASFFLGTKNAHYVRFQEVEPLKTEMVGTVQTLTYHLADYQVYNYRTWREGGLTQAGYFTMDANADNRPQLMFAEADYEAFHPQTVKHDVQWNGGYETGDILMNINERGHLSLAVGQTYDLLPMRSWQLTDNQTNNYFMEPDFHYTVIGTDGQPSKGVVEIDKGNSIDPWASIRAVGEGTAIVLITYDAVGLNYYKAGEQQKTPFLGGEYWSAIWPENTAAFVVTVGDVANNIIPNMTINEAYNEDTKKLAGKYVDAEHDVFYYLDNEEGYRYTFTPFGASSVQIAYPLMGEHMATYNGFSNEGVTAGDDGSYTLLLKEGRQIVRLNDDSGHAVYQVLTAKKCHREIINASRPDSHIFQPGDKVRIQYSGLRHPANKLAGIYNMSAYVTYNGTPNGTSLILSPNQYTFGSAASAQAVTIDIPSDYDAEAQPEMVMDEGVIQVNGYGDPIGNHRNTTRMGGRSANFTAIAHKTYFGAIPEVRLQLTPVRLFTIRPVANVEGVSFSISSANQQVTAGGDGTFTGTYGTYTIKASKPGYRCYRSQFTITDDAEGEQIVDIEMQSADNPDTWDGITIVQPQIDGDGTCLITTAAELAWLANEVNMNSNYQLNAILAADVDLGDYDWTPIGGQKMQTAYRGSFDGQKHTVSGLYIDQSEQTHQALFGYITKATISRLTVQGSIRGRQYVGGVVAFQDEETTVDRCVNHATVTATYGVAGGVSGYHNAWSSTTTNSYNTATISAPSIAGGVVGSNFMTSQRHNCFSIGDVIANSAAGACVGGNGPKNNVSGNYSNHTCRITQGQTTVSEQQMQSGEVAWMLGKAFGQQIETDTQPTIDGPRVYKVVYTSSLSAGTDSLFTNGKLPQLDDIDNRHPVWRTSPDGEELTEVTEDCTLFLDYEEASGVTEIINHDKIPSPVYNLQGHRQKNMFKKGIYIVNGRSVLSM